MEFQQDNTTPTPCGQPNANVQFPPTVDVGSTAVNSTQDLAFQEEVRVYKDAGTADKAFAARLQGVSCGHGSVGSEQATFTQKDVSSEFGVSKAIEIDFQSPSFQGQLFAFLADDSIVTFQFQGAPSADTSTLPSPEDITKKGIQKLSS